MKTVLYFVISAALIWLVANYWTGIWISLKDWYMSALLFALILSLINLLLGTVLRILWLPLNILSLGLFSFVVTIVVIWVTDYLYNGIEIKWFLAYLIVAFIPALASFIVWPSLVKK